jgi:hypothetical protein
MRLLQPCLPRKHCTSNFSRCSRRREHQLLIGMSNPSTSPSSSAKASLFTPSTPPTSTPIPWESMQPRQRSCATRIADPHSGQTTDDSCRWKQTGMLFIEMLRSKTPNDRDPLNQTECLLSALPFLRKSGGAVTEKCQAVTDRTGSTEMP